MKSKIDNPLKKWRIGQRLTRRECARRAQVTPQAWGFWEKGAGVPSDINLFTVAKMVGIDPAKLERDLDARRA